MNNDMPKWYSWVLVGVFCLFIGGISIWNLANPDREFSEMENRTLSSMPKYSNQALFDGTFTASYEKYISDQFVQRDNWVGIKYGIERLLMKTENNGVFFGRKDYLLKKMATPEQERLDLNYKAIGQLIEANPKARVHFSLIPTATHVYKDYLPLWAESYDQSIMLNRGKTEYPENYFDISKELLDNKDKYIFYRTDHHWTSTGAYQGYKAFCKNAGLTPVKLEDLEVQGEYKDFYGTTYTTAGARGLTPDTVTTYKTPNLEITDFEGKAHPMYDLSFADKKDKYSVFQGGNQPLLKIVNHDNVAGGKLLLIKDSYSNALLPFLTYNFSEIHVVDLRFNKTSLKDYVAANQIGDILALYSTDNFATDTNTFVMGK